MAHAPPRPPPPNCTCCVCVRVGACVALRVCVCGTACMHARVPSFTPSTLSHPPAHASKRAKRPIAAAGLQYLSWCLSSRGMDRFEHFRPGLQIGVHFASQLCDQIVQSPPPPPLVPSLPLPLCPSPWPVIRFACCAQESREPASDQVQKLATYLTKRISKNIYSLYSTSLVSEPITETTMIGAQTVRNLEYMLNPIISRALLEKRTHEKVYPLFPGQIEFQGGRRRRRRSDFRSAAGPRQGPR